MQTNVKNILLIGMNLNPITVRPDTTWQQIITNQNDLQKLAISIINKLKTSLDHQYKCFLFIRYSGKWYEYFYQ